MWDIKHMRMGTAEHIARFAFAKNIRGAYSFLRFESTGHPL